MRSCFVFRTHLWNSVHADLVKDYCQQLSGYCPVIVLLNANNQNGSQDLINSWKQFTEAVKADLVVFYEDDLIKQYPWYKGAWLHCQYAFVSIYQAHPNFDYYWLFEYDARYTGSVKDLMINHQHRPEDLLGTHTKNWSQDKTWYWWSHDKVVLNVPLEQRYMYFPAATRISRRLLEVLASEIKTTYSMIESYIPTISVKHFGPSSIGDLDKSLWNPTLVRASPSHGTQDSYQKHILPRPEYKNKLFHPVK